MKPVLLCVAAVATGFLFAADLTVDIGESVTVSANTTYGNVIVNGTLTVAAGKTLSVTTLVVGKETDGTKAEVIVESGAKIAVSSTDANESMILGNGNPAEMTLKAGAVFSSAGGVRLGWGMKPDGSVSPKVKLVLTDATFESAGVLSVQYDSDNKDYSPLAQIDLNGRSAVLRVANLPLHGTRAKFRVRFNGGLVKFDQWYNYGNSAHIRTGSYENIEYILESVDSNPIRICSKGSSGNSIFNCQRGDGTIRLEGDGVVWNEGPTHRSFVSPDNQGKIVFGNGGGIWVPTGCSLLNSKSSAACLVRDYNSGCKLTVAAGGLFDLGGFDISLDGIESAGTVTNASATAATLTVGKDGGDSVFVAPPAGNLPLVKTGSGSLKIPDGDLNQLSVSAGSVEFLNRRDVGFPYYRFHADQKSDNVNIRLTEFAFLNGETDVTANWTAISRISYGGWRYEDPTGAVDRVEETKWDDRTWNTTDARTNTCFFVTHFGGAPAFKFSWFTVDPTAEVFENPSAPIVPVSISQKVTGYKLKENDKDSSYPLRWRFQGGFADGITENRWRDLDVVRNAAYPGAWTWSGVYTASYTNSHVAVANLTLADEGVWTLDVTQGLVEIDTLTPGLNVTVSVSGAKKATGRIVLPVRIGTVNGNLTGWKLHFADIPGAEDRPLVIQDGFLRTAPSGLFLVVR